MDRIKRKDIKRLDKNTNERYLYIDIAKGVGVLLVLLSHSSGFLFGKNFLTAYYMQMFFILAGFTFKYSSSLIGQISKRCKRLLIPYLCYNVFLICIKTVVDKGNLKSLIYMLWGGVYSRYCLYADGRDNNIFFMQAFNSPMWFLTCMFVTNILFYIFMYYAKDKKRKLIGILVFLFMGALLDNVIFLLPWSIDTAFVAVVLMIIGFYLRQKKIFELSKWKQFVCLFVCVIVYKILLILNPSVTMSVREYGPYGIMSVIAFILLGVTGSFMIIFICKLLCQFAVGKMLAHIGRNTIPIMSLHLVCFFLIDSLCAICGIRSEETYLHYVIIWSKCGVTLIVCLICSSLITRGRGLFSSFKSINKIK